MGGIQGNFRVKRTFTIVLQWNWNFIQQFSKFTTNPAACVICWIKGCRLCIFQVKLHQTHVALLYATWLFVFENDVVQEFHLQISMISVPHILISQSHAPLISFSVTKLESHSPSLPLYSAQDLILLSAHRRSCCINLLIKNKNANSFFIFPWFQSSLDNCTLCT